MPGANLTHTLARDRDLGARVVDDGGVVTVWAPRQTSLAVVLDDTTEYEMERLADGYFRQHVPKIGAGRQYWFKLAEGGRPDPASRFQPAGVSGPSMIVDPAAFHWTDDR